MNLRTLTDAELLRFAEHRLVDDTVLIECISRLRRRVELDAPRYDPAPGPRETPEVHDVR